MATTIDIAQIPTLTIKQLKAQIAEVTGQTVRSNNRPYLIGKLTKALEAKAAAEAEQARNAKKTKTARKAATAKSAKTEKATTAKSAKTEKAEKAERRTRTAQRKAGERDPRLPAVGTVLEREHQGKKIRVTVLEDGFRYEGETYSSLSTIARVATGTIWNGFTFFKIAPYPKRNQAQAAA
jgi:hypothetical protein